MNNKKYYSAVAGMFIFSAFFALTGLALAQYDYSGGTADVRVDATARTGVNADGSAEITQNNETDLDFVKSGADASGSSGAGVSDPGEPRSTEVNAASGGDGDDSKSMEIELDSLRPVLVDKASPVVIRAVEVRGWDAETKQEFLGAVKEYAQLQSGQDLENFAKGILLEDENVDSIAIDEEGVQVAYRMPAKFLGIFNSSLIVRVEVDSESVVTAHYPWMRFFFSEPVGALEIEEAVRVEVEEDGRLENVLGLENAFQRKSRMLRVISNVSKAMHETAKSIIQNIRA